MAQKDTPQGFEPLGQAAFSDTGSAEKETDAFAEKHAKEPAEEPAKEPAGRQSGTQARKGNRRFGWHLHKEPVFLLVLVIYLLLLGSRLIDTLLIDRGNTYLIVVLLQLLIFMVPALLYIRLQKISFRRDLRLHAIRLDHFFLLISAMVLLITGGLLLGMLTGGLSSSYGGYMLYDTFRSHADGTVTGVIYLILAYAALPAVCEELVFRGILCKTFEKKSGVLCAAVISALFFALLHFNFAQLPVYFYAGLMLCLVMYITRSLLGSLLVHFIYNLYCVFWQSGFAGFYRTADSLGLLVTILLCAFLLAALLFCFEASRIYRGWAKANLPSDYRREDETLRTLPHSFLYTISTPCALVSILLYAVVVIVRAVL